MNARIERAQIHEQGYERYTGQRLEQTSRFWIVTKNVAVIAWRSRWAVKIPLILAVFTIIGLAVVVYFSGKQEVDFPDGRSISLAEATIVGSSGWLALLTMVLGAALGCSAVADDLKVGAFQFYFSRSLRTVDYVVGKSLGVLAIVAVPMVVVPTVLAIARVAFSESVDDAAKSWPLIPRAFGWGLLGAVAFTLVPLGLGAAMAHKRAAQGIFIAYYLVISNVTAAVASFTKTPWIALFSMRENWGNVGFKLFEIPVDPDAPDPWYSLAALVAFAALGAAGLIWRVRGAEVSSVGGGS